MSPGVNPGKADPDICPDVCTDIDLVVIGEVLVELASAQPLGPGVPLTLGISGDALNAAAAGAAAGARTALLTRIADDELGDVIEGRLELLGIDTRLVRRVRGQQAAYFVHADPTGQREFVYLRTGSAGSGLEPEDVITAGVERAAVVLSSGITAAISASARATVLEAARRAAAFVYDPNYRPKLTSAERAAAMLREVAPYATVVTPACPGETGPLLGENDPVAAAHAVRELGADAVAVTQGPVGTVVMDGSGSWEVPAAPALSLVDQTGAGDSLAGTLAARLALGDDLLDAVRLGSAAAAISLGGLGGTGRVATLAESRGHLTLNGRAPVRLAAS